MRRAHHVADGILLAHTGLELGELGGGEDIFEEGEAGIALALLTGDEFGMNG